MTDVNHPDYYEIETRRGKIECQDLIQALTYDLKGDLAYWDGCFIKYGFRWNRKHKDPAGKLQDLKKARVCLDRMIDIVSLDYNFPINPYGVGIIPCAEKKPTQDTKRDTCDEIEIDEFPMDELVKEYRCNECGGFYFGTEDKPFKYCPYCGREIVERVKDQD